jgi:flavin reductase ActVB
MYETVVEPADFRAARSQVASGGTIVTTRDGASIPMGFTASAFSSLSLDPPLVLVCLDKRAECYDAFANASTMGISILARGQDAIAMRFASRGADKFGPGGLVDGRITGSPLVEHATAQLECEIVDRPAGGDHTILIGRVMHAVVHDVPPMIHYNRKFGEFSQPL